MESNKNLTCQEFIEFLNLYIDDELPAERRQTFEDHLAYCQNCDNYLDSYKKTIKMTVESFNGNPVPDEVPAELINAILATRKL